MLPLVTALSPMNPDVTDPLLSDKKAPPTPLARWYCPMLPLGMPPLKTTLSPRLPLVTLPEAFVARQKVPL